MTVVRSGTRDIALPQFDAGSFVGTTDPDVEIATRFHTIFSAIVYRRDAATQPTYTYGASGGKVTVRGVVADGVYEWIAIGLG